MEGIGHLDNSPIMVTKERTSTQGWQEKVSEEKTGKEVDQHVSEQPETGRFEPNFDKQLFSTGLQTSKTKHKHTQPITRFNLIKKQPPKVFAQKTSTSPSQPKK